VFRRREKEMEITRKAKENENRIEAIDKGRFLPISSKKFDKSRTKRNTGSFSPENISKNKSASPSNAIESQYNGYF
jgi:hypothetical protein